VQWASGYRIDLTALSHEVHLAGGYLCVDAIQSAGAQPIDVQAMGIDFLAADGHKWLLGPEGAGFLFVREDLIEMLHPNVIGWMNMIDAFNWDEYRFEFAKDAQRFEPGSYNVPGTLAVGASIDLLLEIGIDSVWSSINTLTTHMCHGLAEKGYHIFSPRTHEEERSGIVSFVPSEQKPPPHQIAKDLEERNIIIAVRRGRLRASPHFYNSMAQIDQFIEALP